MTMEEYYGAALPSLQEAIGRLLEIIGQYPASGRGTEEPSGEVLYVRSRLKSPESLMAKLKKHGLPLDCASALRQMHDIVGIRVVCSFVEDVYRICRWISDRPELSVCQIKDYIAYPKPNGYRSCHMIVSLTDGPGSGIQAEIQIRTIALDFWAALEHQLKYKHSIPHEELIRSELKRCADEIASIDLSMQTIRELLKEPF